MIYLTSDTHFGHPLCAVLRGFLNDTDDARAFGRVAAYRGSFSEALSWCREHHVPLKDIADVDAHDIAILDGIISTVDPGDDLWVLGDLAFRCGWTRLEQLLDLLLESSRVARDRLHLVLGNHDGCFRLNGNDDSRRCSRERLERYFSSISDSEYLDVSCYNVGNVKKLLLSHFPWRDAAIDSGLCRERLLDAMPSRRSARGAWLAYGHTHSCTWDQYASLDAIHIGCDSWGLRPVSLDDVMLRIETELLERSCR